MSNVKELKQFFQERAIISVKPNTTDTQCDTSIEQQQLSGQHSGYSWTPITNYDDTFDQDIVNDQAFLCCSKQNNPNLINTTNIKLLKNNCTNKHLVNSSDHHNIMNDDDDGTSSISSFKQLISNNNNSNDNNNNNNKSSKGHQTIDQNDEYHNQFARGFNYITGQIGALVTPSEYKIDNRDTSNLIDINSPKESKQQKVKKTSITSGQAVDSQNVEQKRDSYAKKKQSSFASLASFLKRGTSKKSKKDKFKSQSFEGRLLLADFPILEEDTHHFNPSARSNVSSASSIDKGRISETLQDDSDGSGHNSSEKETNNKLQPREISEGCAHSIESCSPTTSYDSPIIVTHEHVDEVIPEKTSKSKLCPTPKPRKSLAKNNYIQSPALEDLPQQISTFTSNNQLNKLRQSSDPKVNMQQMIVNEFMMLTKRQSLLHMFAQNKDIDLVRDDSPISPTNNVLESDKSEPNAKEKNQEKHSEPPPLPPRIAFNTTHQDYINWNVVSEHLSNKTDQEEKNDYYNELLTPTSQSSIDHHLFAYGFMSSSTSSSVDHSDSSDHSDSEEAIYETITEESIANLTHESCDEKADSIVYSKVSDMPCNTLNVPVELNQSQSSSYKMIYPLDAINRIWSSSSEISSTVEDMPITPIRNSSPHHNCMSSIDNFISCPYNKMDAFSKRDNYQKFINKSNDNANVKGIFRIFKKREILALKSGEKFGLTGLEVPLCAGVVKDDCSRKNKHDLKLKKGEVVLVLRMHGNPPGKYLAKSEKGRIGYVDLSNLRVDSQSIKMILRVYGPTRCESVSFPVSEL